jgi:hypothetical protein
MKVDTITITKLTASEGHWLTDGKDYAKVTFPAQGADLSAWYEITEAEYERIMAEQEKAAEQI